MPGRVIMDQQSGNTDPQALKKDRGHGQQGAVQSPPPAANHANGAMNGEVAHGPNGATSNGISHNLETTSGANSKAMATLPIRDPPPLDQSWREAPENKALGVLMERTAQQCFFELNEVINKMAAEGAPKAGAQASSGTGAVEDTDAVSLRKKRQLLEFAQAQRDRFIKALVITDWSRNADEMAGVIDINAYLQKGNWQHTEATRSIGQLKLDMFGAKMPNPNLDGALEVLATGKPHGVPDLGYLPAPRLSAKQLLKTLKGMNVTLATRLALHEELPEHFSDYTIRDGRATFCVPGEFDVDLAVADEDPTSSWFFIDIRFPFTPAPEVIDERIKYYFEAEVNKSIANSGLRGCYDVIHNFVLTHKINVLHSQANDLIRGKWFECIKVERLRRNMVAQYWAGRPGKKSWLEFGIASGKGVKNSSGLQQATPIIAVRWFQDGAEVKEALEIDWQSLDLEKILLQAISRQTTSILGAVQSGLKTLAANATGFSTEMQPSEDETVDNGLVLRQRSLEEPVRVIVEPVTGQYSILPASPAAADAEHRLNNDPAVDASRCLAKMLYFSSLAVVEKHVGPLGWSPVVNLARQENLRALFGEDLGQFRLFSPKECWSDKWAIAVSVGLGGNKWWIVRLDAIPETGGRIISIARQLRATSSAAKPVSRNSLLQIEKLAVAEVSYTALSLQLQEAEIPHQLERQSQLTSDGASPQDQRLTAIFIGFTKLMGQPKNWKAWAQEPVRVTHHSDYIKLAIDEADMTLTRHEFRLTLREDFLKNLHRHLTKAPNQDVAMNKTGGLALRLYTPFGAPFLDQLRARLLSIKRLDRHVSLLKDCHIRCDTVSLSRLAFTYSSNPPLSAQLSYSSDGGLPVKLKFEPRDSNLHLRIRVLLEQALNRNLDDAFPDFVRTLLSTLPILRAVEGIETQHSQKLTPVLHVRSPTWYSLKYKSPLPNVTFQLRARLRFEGTQRRLRWHVEQERTKVDKEDLPELLRNELKELWNTSTKDYLGAGTGVIGKSEGVAKALGQIDGVVRRHGGAGEPASSRQEQPAQQAAGQPNGPAGNDRVVIALD